SFWGALAQDGVRVIDVCQEDAALAMRAEQRQAAVVAREGPVRHVARPGFAQTALTELAVAPKRCVEKDAIGRGEQLAQALEAARDTRDVQQRAVALSIAQHERHVVHGRRLAQTTQVDRQLARDGHRLQREPERLLVGAFQRDRSRSELTQARVIPMSLERSQESVVAEESFQDGRRGVERQWLRLAEAQQSQA